MIKNRTSRVLQHPPYSQFQGYLKENGVNLKEIAKLIGKTVSRVSTNNNGFTDYKYDEVKQICDHLKISTEIFRPRNTGE